MWKGGERLKKSGFFFSEFTSRYLPWVPEVFFRVRRGPFVLSAAGRRHEGHFLRLPETAH